MATGDYIAKFNPRSIRKRQPFMYRDLVPGGGAKSKASQAAAIVAGVPAAREVALANLGSGAEAAYPIQPDIYGGQDTDALSPGPTQITDPNAPQNIPSQRESTPMMGMEQQEAIANQGRGARYDADSIMGLVSSLAGTPKANKAFDSTKPIGGENVPYKPAGIFQRVLGNQANMLNLGAQQAQGAEWKAESDAAKARDAELGSYREKKRIDAEIEDARDDKRNAQAITMFDKAQAAQRELLQLQQDFTKARTAEEQDNILKRMGVAHTNAMTLQNNALAATANNQALAQTFQAKLANFNLQGEAWRDSNKITNLGDGFFARGSEVYGTSKGMPGYKPGDPGVPPSVTPPLTGPAGKGAQLPQMDVGGTAPTMGTQRGVTTQPRSSGGRLFDILEGNETPMEPEATAEATSAPVAAVDESTLGPTPAIPGASMPREEAPTNAPRFGPFLMEEFQKRAKTLAKDARSRPNAADPLMLPMFENIAKSLGIGSEGVGASRQVRRPASAVVERDLGSYLPKFGQLPQEEQNAAVLDALNKSMRQPRYRTFPNFEYNYNAQ